MCRSVAGYKVAGGTRTGEDRDGIAGGDVGWGERARGSGDTKAGFREELWEWEHGRAWK